MANSGKVFLVGAGPGDPGLITLKALKCLSQADFVLYDGLVNPLLLLNTSADTERTCRSHTAHGRMLNQTEINQRLIDEARSGKTVVRLKGGDPFIFGRGGEEAEALRTAGIDYEIVPGVTAATGASAYAGVSLTHRKWASAVAFVTGHEDPAKTDSLLDYAALAAFPGTLVFYMGLHRLEEITRRLIEFGKSPATPAIVISQGTTSRQQSVTAPLSDLPAAVRQAQLRAPSLIVVGDCVRQRETIRWFEQRPLLGRRIGIPRPLAQALPVVEQANDLGADCLLMPTIDILPPEDWTAVDEAISRLADYDWLIFTSANGVEYFLSRLRETGGDMRDLGGLKLATIGPATAAALETFHLTADLVPPEFRAESLAATLAPHVQGQRLLWARASRGRDVLPQTLQGAGATVDEVVTYQNVDVDNFDPQVVEVLDRGEVDWIALSSPSIARQLRQLLSPEALGHIGKTIRLASISPVTTAAAQEAGLTIHAEARDYSWPGLFTAIQEFESAR
ncbi:Uroporphyrinogen-III C-methyltransferase [Symmachiella dynata]|uniref:uroporphyrinogen-III C-methyltransferase n=1 Tax=Symmachiella dynata TaxID=2527995 RepID=A0A517ZVE1_9PLAN|nr:uroporphyrinogen-III C-methyltransferase [Symmachiella dynata]QDU46454.1 Uroporphyrinogen-III C-methyltransferase [Symmachiella dynata]